MHRHAWPCTAHQNNIVGYPAGSSHLAKYSLPVDVRPSIFCKGMIHVASHIYALQNTVVLPVDKHRMVTRAVHHDNSLS
jgi:hypothetical protein